VVPEVYSGLEIPLEHPRQSEATKNLRILCELRKYTVYVSGMKRLLVVVVIQGQSYFATDRQSVNLGVEPLRDS